MRKFVVWHALKCKHGQGSWSIHDSIVIVVRAHGRKATQLGGHSPESIARILIMNMQAGNQTTQLPKPDKSARSECVGG